MGVNKMAIVYADLIEKKQLKLKSVPSYIRTDVEKVLQERGWVINEGQV